MRRRGRKICCPVCRDAGALSKSPVPTFIEQRVLRLLFIQTYFCWVCEVQFKRFSRTPPRKRPGLLEKQPQQQVDFELRLSELQASIHAAESNQDGGSSRSCPSNRPALKPAS